jgi:hypothetical protein
MGTAHMFQQEQAAAKAQDAAHFLQNGQGIGHVAQKEGADYLIKGSIRKSQMVDIGLAQLYHGARPTAAGYRQHLGAGVHRYHAAAGRVERQIGPRPHPHLQHQTRRRARSRGHMKRS